jgi:hypothetical protein
MRKVLVCGAAPRTKPPKPGWEDKEAIIDVLHELRQTWGEKFMVIHGGAKGADILAGQAAFGLGLHVHTYPAEWHIYGNAAGPVRNRRMLDENPEVELVIAFHDQLHKSSGTKDMLKEAIKRHIPVVHYSHGEDSKLMVQGWPSVEVAS